MQNPFTTLFSLMLFILLLTGCKSDEAGQSVDADLILHHAYVYPVVGEPIADGAVVIRDGKIIAVGNNDAIIKNWKKDKTELMDCAGQFLMPGFIEGHGHFHSLGKNLLELNLLATSSWEEILDSVRVRVEQAKPGEWIVGRGWHQEKWNAPVSPSFSGYPYHDELSRLSPDNPVLLKHASGHSVIANAKAMEVSNITAESADPDGGLIVRDKQNKAIGVFEENALDLIEDVHDAHIANLTEAHQNAQWLAAIAKAQAHCLQHGITSFQDAGSTFEEIIHYQAMAKSDSLQLRLYAMIYDKLDSLRGRLDAFPIVGEGDDFFTCRALKTYYDGALGSYGAWLLEPYADRPGYQGQVTTSVADMKEIAELGMQKGMQVAVHAIGDQANRNVLDLYEAVMKTQPEKKDLRWRIEHAQHIDPADVPRFASLGVIASMQAIHCTSDAPFVVKRLGEERARTGAYPWRSLLDAGVVIANGTDAPVEKVDPIENFYASVTRKRPDSGMEFFPEQAMTRKEALYSMTMANAYAAFEEDSKGSIEVGKYADLVLLDQNLSMCEVDSILRARVMMTVVGGKVMYKREP